MREGPISPFQQPSPGIEQILNQYVLSEDEYRREDQYKVIIRYLIEERYLFPTIDLHNNVSLSSAQGITPKGIERLNRLQHPVHTWIKDNWFPTTIAATTIIAAGASVAVNIIVKL